MRGVKGDDMGEDTYLRLNGWEIEEKDRWYVGYWWHPKHGRGFTTSEAVKVCRRKR